MSAAVEEDPHDQVAQGGDRTETEVDHTHTEQVISIRDENNKVMNEARENARDILRNTLTEIIYSQEQTEEEKYS